MTKLGKLGWDIRKLRNVYLKNWESSLGTLGKFGKFIRKIRKEIGSLGKFVWKIGEKNLRR